MSREIEEITEDFILRVIEDTIELDKKLNDPVWRKQIEEEEERIRQMDLSSLFKNE